jgi:hypothetical protein
MYNVFCHLSAAGKRRECLLGLLRRFQTEEAAEVLPVSFGSVVPLVSAVCFTMHLSLCGYQWLGCGAFWHLVYSWTAHAHYKSER